MHAEAEIERSGKAPFLSEILDNLTQRGLNLLRRGRGLHGRTNQDLVQLGNLLLSRRGEASGVAIAEMLLTSFEQVDEHSRLAFLHALANEFGADRHRVDAAVQAYLADPSNPDLLDRLHSEAEPRRQELLRRLNLASGGTAALVQMRELICEHIPGNPDLARVDADFAHLFSSWFNRGFLVLRRIDWTTPANILEKIIRYEAVHAIRDWDDLRRRLEPPDRRCYAFFHPQLGDEPLIFVEIALTDGIPEAIDPLLAPASTAEKHREPTTAVFYSISNTQKGLAGVSFGNFLIKQVVETLKTELPSLRTFVTLSPVPGFRAWLDRQLSAESSDELWPGFRAAAAILDSDWDHDEISRGERRKFLLRAAAHYFLGAKRLDGRPVDPVARFHLGNGARLERINFPADLSQRGLEQSYGVMVNYLYSIQDLEANHEAYTEEGVIAASPAVRNLQSR